MADQTDTVVIDESDDLAEARARIAALEEENEKIREEAARYRPFVDMPVFTDVAQVIEAVGRERLEELAQSKLAKENKRRQKEGLPPLWADNKRDYQNRVEELIREEADDIVKSQSKWIDTDPSKLKRSRSLKMVKPDGTMVQIPVEPQVNNGAGSLADPIEKYKRKGYKMTSPPRCPLYDCWRPSAVEHGHFTYGGYCSQVHHQVMEGTTVDRDNGLRMTMTEVPVGGTR